MSDVWKAWEEFYSRHGAFLNPALTTAVHENPPASTGPFADYTVNPWAVNLELDPEVGTFVVFDVVTTPVFRFLFNKNMGASDLLRIQSGIGEYSKRYRDARSNKEPLATAWGEVTRSDLVDAIEMAVYFSRNFLGWDRASEKLEYFLDAGNAHQPYRTESFAGTPIEASLSRAAVDYFYDSLLRNMESRINTGSADGDEGVMKIVNPGETQAFIPKIAVPHSVNGAVITEEFYFGTTYQFPLQTQPDLYFAYGTIHLYSHVFVERELDSTGNWQCRIVSWRSWGFDAYDWGLLAGVSLPINLRSKIRLLLNDSAGTKSLALPGSMTMHEMANANPQLGDLVVNWLERYCLYHGIPFSLLDELIINDGVLGYLVIDPDNAEHLRWDEQPKQVPPKLRTGPAVKMPDGRTLKPAEYYIFIDAWEHDASAYTTARPATFVIASLDSER